MSSSATSSVSAQRLLPLRMRPDLVVLALDVRGRRCWRIKDPVALEYFQLTDEEYFILSHLDGTRSLADLQQQFESRFAPTLLGMPRLQSYLAHLHRTGLILADTPGQSTWLLEMQQSVARRSFWGKFLNPLAIQFRGFDPDPWLKRLYPWCRWCFTAPACLLALGLMLAALMLLISQFDRIQTRVPEFRAFLTPSGLGWLAFTLFITKVLHELGHALAARHYGVECHEMGVLLLVFTPCLYCNVSDAWMLREKRPRLLISAAGIIVEFVLASLGLFFWWLTQPGLWNAIWFDVVLVCSVGTLIFNGNPLLRYDGYYLVSDWFELPNLAERSSRVLEQSVVNWLTAQSYPDELEEQPRTARWLFLYGVLAAAYRAFIVLTILWVCWRWFTEMSLRSLGLLFIVVILIGWIVVPTRQFLVSLRETLMHSPIHRGRMLWSVALLALVAAGALLLPIPQNITTQAFIQRAESQSVHVTVPGRLLTCLPVGTPVQSGDQIAELENLQLARDIDKLERESARLQIRLRNLESRQAVDPLASKSIPAAREELAEAQDALRHRQQDAAQLKLTAPCAGVILPPPNLPRSQDPGAGLPAWSGMPQDSRNAGCWLEPGTLFCAVGAPDESAATLIISQSEIELVQPGQPVRILLDQFPGQILSGRVTEIAAMNLELVPVELLGDRETAVRRQESGQISLAETSYQARVAVDPSACPLSLRARGRAKIRLASATLAEQLARLVRQTLHFRLEIFP
ncbi:MAG: HlyD family efflux transporter periplasmic adaptor subunit [Planctomycetes bacterium]|nr:HlyD family efflux transporter periplasmic adaptor subunit [Planctomycetota bacterium]